MANADVRFASASYRKVSRRVRRSVQQQLHSGSKCGRAMRTPTASPTASGRQEFSGFQPLRGEAVAVHQEQGGPAHHEKRHRSSTRGRASPPSSCSLLIECRHSRNMDMAPRHTRVHTDLVTSLEAALVTASTCPKEQRCVT